MGYFQVRYDSRVVHYDRRGFIRLATVKAFSVGVGLNKNLYILEPTFLDIGSVGRTVAANTRDARFKFSH